SNSHQSPTTTDRRQPPSDHPPSTIDHPRPRSAVRPLTTRRPPPPPAPRLFIGRGDDETERYQRTITVLRNTRRRPITSRISALNGDRDPTFKITQSRLIIGTQRTRRISRHRL